MDIDDKYKDDPLIKFMDICYQRTITTLYVSLVLALTIFGITLVLGGLKLISFYWAVLPGFFLAMLLSATFLFEKKPK
ncbi:hypothetical protein K0B04_01605 [Patescibacteria group bacterium]|nr:hypothetical protein [Patescibacteria group bacterium]